MKKVIPFVKFRYIAYAVSALLFIGFFAGTVARGGMNWGIDFAGGVKITAKFEKKVSAKEVQDAIEKSKLSVSVQQIGEEEKNEFIIFSKLINKDVYEFVTSEFVSPYTIESLSKAIEADKYAVTLSSQPNTLAWLNELLTKPEFYKSWIEMKKISDPALAALAAGVNMSEVAKDQDVMDKLIQLNRKVIEKTYSDKTPVAFADSGSSDKSLTILRKAILKNFPDAQVLSVESVGPAIGSYLKKSAIKLGIIAILMMTVYLAFRFEFRYSLGAMLALMHDVAVCFLLCGVLNIEFDIPVLAALLTVFGYSVNDTIVVFDRIRENVDLKSSPKLTTIINMSVTQTLSRTILTSLLTALAVVSLLIFGGPTIKNFAIILLFGITVGTFSSIYVASPLVLAWEKYVNKNKEY